ncbi:Aspartic proteinase 36 [Linum perenne]
MASVFPASVVVVVVVVLLAVAVVAVAAFPATLQLERGIPLPSRKVGLSQLSARDSVRHRRMLQSSSSSSAAGGVVDFSVQGTFNPFLVGLYYTKLQLGSPPKDFYVQIDTGSDVLWVSCNNCNGCPVSSGLQIPLNFFDSGSSSTSSLISCSDQRCALGIEAADSGCFGQTNNQCGYTFQYGDGSGTSGYYVQDMLHLDTIVGGSVTTNSTVPIVFGCSILQTGDLTKPDRAVDGIFGFGQQGLSVVSQLAAQGVAPRAFSHCLKGDDGGGGILVLGEIVEPNIVYTPLVPSQPHYNVNLQSISVGGQSLAIDPSVFSTSGNKGTIVDSGTTLAYLAEPAYGPFISAGGAAVWCIGFQKMQGQGVTILGDLILKDKIFVYDIANQRVGWTKYDCSMSVNVSTVENTGRTEFVNAGQLGNNGSPRNRPTPASAVMITLILLHMVGSCLFL